jgi:hypothetical protein
MSDSAQFARAAICKDDSSEHFEPRSARAASKVMISIRGTLAVGKIRLGSLAVPASGLQWTGSDMAASGVLLHLALTRQQALAHEHFQYPKRPHLSQ